MPTLFRNFYRRFTGGASGNVDCRVCVRVAGEPAKQAQEIRLALAVGLRAMPAAGACSAGVSRIDGDHGNAEQLALVGDEGTKLIKAPSAHLRPLPFAEPCAGSDALEVFKSDSSPGVFAKDNELLADDVVLMTAETRFFAADAFNGPACVLPGAPLVPAVHLLSQGSADVMVFDADGLNAVSADYLAVAGSRNHIHAQIDAKKISGRRGRSFRKIDRTEQEPFSVLSENKVALPLAAAEPLPLIPAHDHRHDDSALKRQQAHTVDALEAHYPVVVGHGRVLAEVGPLVLVPLVGFADLGNTADGHLAGQTESLAERMIVGFLEFDLVGDLQDERFSSQPVGGGVEPLNGFTQGHRLAGVGKELDLNRQLHEGIIERFNHPNKGGGHSSHG